MIIKLLLYVLLLGSDECLLLSRVGDVFVVNG